MSDFTHLDVTTTAGRLAMTLAEDPEIVTLVDNRILDFDPRTVGWDLTPDNVQLFDAYKKLKPCIIVDESTAVAPVFGPRGGVEEDVFVWVMTSASRNNARLVPKLMKIIRAVLPGQHSLGGPMVSWTFSMNLTPTEGGFMARHTFKVSGIPKNRIG